jgi:hypothetical protein
LRKNIKKYYFKKIENKFRKKRPGAAEPRKAEPILLGTMRGPVGGFVHLGPFFCSIMLSTLIVLKIIKKSDNTSFDFPRI